ncbi:MAG: SDR family oxidoreductase [Verrucomicrobiales bacterium]
MPTTTTETDPASIEPRRALITGGEGDLAQAIRAELERCGYAVGAPGRGELDVADADSVAAYMAGCGRIDLLVINAGCIRDTPLSRMADADWDAVMAANLRGAFLCARAAMKAMLRQRAGHVAAIGSFSALAGPAGQANYAAAKAGLIALTKSLAKEGGSRGIRANCILPGFLETKMTRGVTAARRAAVLADHALGRFNSPAEAARFLRFLDLEMASVSGQVFQLDSRIGRW